MQSNTNLKVLSPFQINTTVLCEFLEIKYPNQLLIDQLINCDSNAEVRKIKKIEGCKDWDKLKYNLLAYFQATQQTFGKPINKYIQQVYEDFLIQYRIFYEGLLEFQTCIMLNQYLIIKQKIYKGETILKQEFQKLINMLIWKSNQLHFIIRIILGYIVHIKISKNTNIDKVFEQISKLIEKSLKNGASYNHQIFKSDIEQFSIYWHKIIKVKNNDNHVNILLSLLQQSQFYFNDTQFQINTINSLKQMKKLQVSILSQTYTEEQQSIQQKKKPILQINNLLPKNIKERNHHDLSRIVKTEQTQASSGSKRIIKRPIYQNIEEDPIFQIQVENYHINQIVRKGCFKIKQPVTLSTQRYKTQPTMQDELPLLTFQDFEQIHQDSVLELPSPMKPINESEQRISGREPSITHSQSSQGKIEKLNTQSNPYRLKNLIGSKFQQILDIAQQSAQSTPKNSELLSRSIKRQKTISIKKEHKELQQQISIPALDKIPTTVEQQEQITSERRRSGMVVSSPDAVSIISQAIQKNSLIDSGQLKPQTATLVVPVQNIQQQQLPKRPIRRNLLTLRTATTFFMEQSNAYIPKFKFSLCYFNRTIIWESSIQMAQNNVVSVNFYDITKNKIIYTCSLENIQIENIKNWTHIIEVFINQFSQQTNHFLNSLSYNANLSLKNKNTTTYSFIKYPNYQFELTQNEIEQMGILKDLFRWMYTTYLFEQININGIMLKIQNEKEKTLIAYRELINVVLLYRKMIIRATICDEKEKFHLLIKSYGECIKNNIILLNRILNNKIHKQKDQKYIIHKQLVNFRKLSITQDDENFFFIVKVSLLIQKDLLYYKKNNYHTKQWADVLFEAVDSPIKITPLKLQFDAIEKILENKYYNDLRSIINGVFFSQRKHFNMFYDFIQNKLMINEQKQLQVKMNIFSIQDAQKMEACGMKLGFLIDLKNKVKPFAITEIERYIYDDTQKKLDYAQKSQTIHNRERMFDKHFAQIFGEDINNNEQQNFSQSSLIDLVRRYQPSNTEIKQEIISKKVGPIVIYQENPFTDIHVDDLEKLKSQFYTRNDMGFNKKYFFRVGLKHLVIQINQKLNSIKIIYHWIQRFYQFIITPLDDEDGIIEVIKSLLKNGPNCWIVQMIYKKVLQRALKQSFISSQLNEGLELLKSKKSKSQLAEIPSYNVLHYYILNNYLVLLKYFTLKQFVLVHKIKNYGKFQITIKVFFRCQKPEILAENDYFLMRIDFQNIQFKTGMMKMIFNKYDINEILKIEIPDQLNDANVVKTAMNIFQKCHLGKFQLSSVPFFSFSVDEPRQSESQFSNNSFEDHSIKMNVQQMRRIGNFPENTTFKKSDSCKGFLEQNIKNSRLIISHIKKYYLLLSQSTGQLNKISHQKFHHIQHDQIQTCDYVIFQVYRHLLLDIWIIKVYVPKTTRQMVGIIKSDEFKETECKGIIENLHPSKKPLNLSFKDLDSFVDFTPRQSIGLKKSVHRMSQPKNSQFQSPNISCIQTPQLGQSQVNQLCLSDFLILTKSVTEITEQNLDTNNKETLIQKEKFIWINIMNNSINLESHPKIQNCYMSLLFDQKEICLQELLFQRYIRIERVGESHIEFYMKYSQKNDQLKGIALLKGKINQMNQHNNKFPSIISEVKLNEEQIKFVKRTCIFFAYDAINYANTSNFNIELKYFSYNKFTEVKEQINLRELLNLYIADGFYKYQTNYMNSKLNHSDIISICYYMIHKIKTQNFLNLSQYHTIPNLNQFKTQKLSNKIQKPIRHSTKIFKKPFIYQIQLLYNEVQVTCIHWKTCSQINEVFTYSYLNQNVMYFKYFVDQYPKLALDRIADIIDKLVTVNHHK